MDSNQPFSYQRTHDLKDQKVIFNPIGRYATYVTFLLAEIPVPYSYIELLINQTEDFINQLHQHIDGSIFQASTRNTLEYMRAPVKYARIRMAEILQKQTPTSEKNCVDARKCDQIWRKFGQFGKF